MTTTATPKKTMMRYAISATLVGAMTFTSATVASATTTAPSAATGSTQLQSAPTGEILYLSEADLAELGLTKADAEQITKDFTEVVNSAEEAGDITASEADTLRDSLATPPGGAPNSPDDSVATAAALPVWAAAAIVGCAGGAILGQGKTQITNALQSGASVDEATDIAIGAGVDCVFGAVPGGAIGAAAKNKLTQPIKDALRPHVKKGVQNIKDNQD